MRRTYFYVTAICFIVCLLFSCANKEKVLVKNYSDDFKIIDSPNKPLQLLEQQPYLSFGKIEQPFFPDSMKVEQNLISQITAYNSAMLHGDIKTCMGYFYPDALNYCKKYYAGLSDIEVFEEMMKDMSDQLQEMITVCEARGIEVSIVVPNLVRKVQYGNDVIIVYNTTTNFCSEYVYTYNKEMGHDIGVSKNGGVNWSFFTENEDTPTILKMHYPQEVVNKIMGYSF